MEAHAHELGRDSIAGTFKVVGERVPIRTLVVDDTRTILEVICAVLETEDRVEVVGHATDGCEALVAVRSLQPDLVFMDVQMPHMDGLTAAALIRSAFPQIYIVLMSADPFYESEARASGADEFVDKVEFCQVFPRVLNQLTTATENLA